MNLLFCLFIEFLTFFDNHFSIGIQDNTLGLISVYLIDVYKRQTLGVPVELFTVPVLSEPREYEAAEYWRYELGAVSYTHLSTTIFPSLSLTKSQSLTSLFPHEWSGLNGRMVTSKCTVSYTHLDVYKRQALH